MAKRATRGRQERSAKLMAAAGQERAMEMDLELFRAGERDRKTRQTLPGGRSGGRISGFGQQQGAKQAMQQFYRVRTEGRFRRYFKEAARRSHVSDDASLSTGLILLRMLESRLDNVVYLIGFAATRDEAKQMIYHGHIEVKLPGAKDFRRVTISSYDVPVDSEVRVSEKAKTHLRVVDALEEAEKHSDAYHWIDRASTKEISGKVSGLPELEDRSLFDIQKVVEFYSR